MQIMITQISLTLSHYYPTFYRSWFVATTHYVVPYPYRATLCLQVW